jgi:zinc protease
VTLADPRVAQPSVSRYYLVPSSTTARPGESEPLEVLAHILGRGSNSRLYRALVVDKGIAINAGASYDSTAVDATRLAVYASPKPGTTLAGLEEALDSVLAEVMSNGVTAEELERAKSRMIADAIYANDNQRTMAQWYGAALVTGASVDDVRAWPSGYARSARITCARLRAVGWTSAVRSPAISSRTPGPRINAHEPGFGCLPPRPRRLRGDPRRRAPCSRGAARTL